jgi:hypothetical protein
MLGPSRGCRRIAGLLIPGQRTQEEARLRASGRRLAARRHPCGPPASPLVESGPEPGSFVRQTVAQDDTRHCAFNKAYYGHRPAQRRDPHVAYRRDPIGSRAPRVSDVILRQPVSLYRHPPAAAARRTRARPLPHRARRLGRRDRYASIGAVLVLDATDAAVRRERQRPLLFGRSPGAVRPGWDLRADVCR